MVNLKPDWLALVLAYLPICQSMWVRYALNTDHLDMMTTHFQYQRTNGCTNWISSITFDLKLK